MLEKLESYFDVRREINDVSLLCYQYNTSHIDDYTNLLYKFDEKIIGIQFSDKFVKYEVSSYEYVDDILFIVLKYTLSPFDDTILAFRRDNLIK